MRVASHEGRAHALRRPGASPLALYTATAGYTKGPWHPSGFDPISGLVRVVFALKQMAIPPAYAQLSVPTHCPNWAQTPIRDVCAYVVIDDAHFARARSSTRSSPSSPDRRLRVAIQGPAHQIDELAVAPLGLSSCSPLIPVSRSNFITLYVASAPAIVCRALGGRGSSYARGAE
jgi:hypothetical protein